MIRVKLWLVKSIYGIGPLVRSFWSRVHPGPFCGHSKMSKILLNKTQKNEKAISAVLSHCAEPKFCWQLCLPNRFSGMLKKLADSKICYYKNFENLIFKLLTTFPYTPWMISKLSTSMSCPWSQLSGDIIFSSADQVDNNKIFIYCLKITMGITFLKFLLNKSWSNL